MPRSIVIDRDKMKLKVEDSMENLNPKLYRVIKTNNDQLDFEYKHCIRCNKDIPKKFWKQHKENHGKIDNHSVG